VVSDPHETVSAAPLVTVVIPTRDRPDMVRRAIESALAQTVSEVEVIVVDDASTPPIRSIADPRVRVIRRNRAGGLCAARNEGLAPARGRWVVFLDDDDELLPDMVEVSLEAARSSALPPPVAVMSCARVVDETGTVIDVRCPPAALPKGSRWSFDATGDGRFRSPRTLVAPLDVVRSIGGFDERFRAMEDTDFYIRLNAVCSLQGVSRETYRKWEHTGPKLLSQPIARAEGIRLNLEKHGDLFATDKRRHAKVLGTMAIGYLMAGKWGTAVASAARAVTRDPRRIRGYGQLIACLAGRRAFLRVSGLRHRVLPGRSADRAAPGA
jgi:glycosyltransferase involved in cell wall biosynthesis